MISESLFHPTFDRFSQLPQPALKEMIRTLDHNQLLRLWHRRNQLLQLRPRTKLVARPTHK